ncbi:unnamed protein product [Prorocentrum cordatum]|uniref:Uncharacterized protein n=1 Tax=Prorocentrum cordatum TaxID=2364126 RepID=A0ABN9Q1E2_9DINO|nr:unnamed protein product [Polarella glacialis]
MAAKQVSELCVQGLREAAQQAAKGATQTIGQDLGKNLASGAIRQAVLEGFKDGAKDAIQYAKYQAEGIKFAGEASKSGSYEALMDFFKEKAKEQAEECAKALMRNIMKDASKDAVQKATNKAAAETGMQAGTSAGSVSLMATEADTATASATPWILGGSWKALGASPSLDCEPLAPIHHTVSGTCFCCAARGWLLRRRLGRHGLLGVFIVRLMLYL